MPTNVTNLLLSEDLSSNSFFNLGSKNSGSLFTTHSGVTMVSLELDVLVCASNSMVCEGTQVHLQKLY